VLLLLLLLLFSEIISLRRGVVEMTWCDWLRGNRFETTSGLLACNRFLSSRSRVTTCDDSADDVAVVDVPSLARVEEEELLFVDVHLRSWGSFSPIETGRIFLPAPGFNPLTPSPTVSLGLVAAEIQLEDDAAFDL
jgi:hypothetical protein